MKSGSQPDSANYQGAFKKVTELRVELLGHRYSLGLAEPLRTAGQCLE